MQGLNRELQLFCFKHLSLSSGDLRNIDSVSSDCTFLSSSAGGLHVSMRVHASDGENLWWPTRH